MSKYNLDKITKRVALFTEHCDDQIREVKTLQETREKKVREENEQRERIKTRFEETILQDLQQIMQDVSPRVNSPYLRVVLDTHLQHSEFVIGNNSLIPAYAIFAIGASAEEDFDECFANARYLLFAAPTSLEDSFRLSLNNEERSFTTKGGNEDDSAKHLKDYTYDNYNLDEIKDTISKYLLEELVYHQEHFKVPVPEEDEEYY